MKVVCRIKLRVRLCMRSYTEVFIMSLSKGSLPRGSVLWRLCNLEVHIVFTPSEKREWWVFHQPQFVENQPFWKGCTWIWVLSLVWVTSRRLWFKRVKSSPLSLHVGWFQSCTSVSWIVPRHAVIRNLVTLQEEQIVLRSFNCGLRKPG